MRRTGALVATCDVNTLEGAEVPDALGTLVNIFTGASILFQEVTLATVALIRAIDVSALLTARLLVTFIYIFTVLAIQCEGEASCAGAVVGAWGVFTGLGTQPARIAPALIYIGADLAQDVILVARLTVTAVAAREVVTDLAHSTAMRPHLTLINVDTLGSVGAGMVTVAAHYDLLLARVGAHCVDTVKT